MSVPLSVRLPVCPSVRLRSFLAVSGLGNRKPLFDIHLLIHVLCNIYVYILLFFPLLIYIFRGYCLNETNKLGYHGRHADELFQSVALQISRFLWASLSLAWELMSRQCLDRLAPYGKGGARTVLFSRKRISLDCKYQS